MNYLAHAYQYLHDPYFATGTAVPDWLSVVDRRVRLRPPIVLPYTEATDGAPGRLATGILRHLEDDRRFHGTEAFSEALTAVLNVIRPTLLEVRIPPVFLSHLLVEVLLDAALAARHPETVEAYYRVLAGVSAETVASVTSRIAHRPVPGLAPFVRLFCRERILFDYLEDDKLWLRLGQVMCRLRLPPLPLALFGCLPQLRPMIAARQEGLLAPCLREGTDAVRAIGQPDHDNSPSTPDAPE